MDIHSLPEKPVVLAVDDNEDNLFVLKRPIKKEGYSLLTAMSGPEAINILETHKVDVILLDWMMPVVSGIEVMRQIKKHPEWRLIPIIMVTAKASLEDVREGLREGASDYMAKPFDSAELLARIGSSMRERFLTMELVESNKRLEASGEFIKNAFGRFVSDEVVESALASPSGLDLGGDKRKVTILMSDLCGFTSISEYLPPEKVVEMLNRYFEVMINIIGKYRGTICDFVGDGMMVLFGAPIIGEDDSRRALLCAIEMQQAMPGINKNASQVGLPEIEMAIGINTGEVVAGNMGSAERVKYSVVGNTVNLTARIESFASGGQVLISNATLNDIGTGVSVDGDIAMQAKGISDAVTLYKVRGVEGEEGMFLPPEQEDVVLLEKETPVEFYIMENKASPALPTKGILVRLTQKEAVLRSETKLLPFTDLKISLASVDPSLSDTYIYAKVAEALEEDEATYRLSLSPLPVEVKKALAG